MQVLSAIVSPASWQYSCRESLSSIGYAYMTRQGICKFTVAHFVTMALFVMHFSTLSVIVHLCTIFSHNSYLYLGHWTWLRFLVCLLLFFVVDSEIPLRMFHQEFCATKLENEN